MRPRILMRNRLLIVADLFLIIVAALGSFALRTDLGPLFKFYLPQAYWLIAIPLLVKPIVFYSFGLYRRLWVYASVQELKLIVVAVTTASVVVSLVIVTLRAVEVLPYFPRSTLPIVWLLSLILIGGLRFSLRILSETSSQTAKTRSIPQRFLRTSAM